MTLRAGVAGAGNQFGRLARRFDLAVVGQDEPETSAVEEVIVEAALFDFGRPVIVVPYIQKAPLKLDQVMVTWDGGRPAARAIGDAMPLLKRAGRIEVVIVANERSKQDEIEGADMAQHLARHGLNVEVKRSVLADIDVADDDSFARRRRRHRFHCYGRLRPLKAARIRARRRNPQHPAFADGPSIDVALAS